MPPALSGADLQRAAIDEVRNVQLNICNVYNKNAWLRRHWMLALNTRELAFKSHEEAQQCVQEAEAEFCWAQARMQMFQEMFE